MLSTTYNRVRILPYSPVSQGAKVLADRLEGKRIKLKGSKFHGTSSDLIINWGNCKGLPFTMEPDAIVLNHPDAVSEMANKLSFFEYFMDKDWLPRFWVKQEDIPDEAFPIVCRTVLNGHSGNGIVIANSRDLLVPAPLYVEYIKKQKEYRVHIGSYNDDNGNNEYCVIAVQQKKRKTDFENPNWQVRNYQNGFIYARNDIDPPISVVESAIDCLAGSDLDFAAVDVIWNESKQQAYVLEVNTAPGLEGQTVDDYVNYFKGVSKCLSTT